MWVYLDCSIVLINHHHQTNQERKKSYKSLPIQKKKFRLLKIHKKITKKNDGNYLSCYLQHLKFQTKLHLPPSLSSMSSPLQKPNKNIVFIICKQLYEMSDQSYQIFLRNVSSYIVLCKRFDLKTQEKCYTNQFYSILKHTRIRTNTYRCNTGAQTKFMYYYFIHIYNIQSLSINFNLKCGNQVYNSIQFKPNHISID